MSILHFLFLHHDLEMSMFTRQNHCKILTLINYFSPNALKIQPLRIITKWKLCMSQFYLKAITCKVCGPSRSSIWILLPYIEKYSLHLYVCEIFRKNSNNNKNKLGHKGSQNIALMYFA